MTINGYWQNFGLVNLNSGTKFNGTGLFWNCPDGVIRGQGAIETSSYNEGLIHANASGRLTLSNFAGNYPSGEMRVDDGSTLRVLSGSSISNEGLIVLGGATAVLAGDQIENTGSLLGQGRVTNSMSNTGVIRAEGGRLTLAGAIVENTNLGLLEAPAGGTVFVTQGLATNEGQIALDGGAFDNNNHPLINSGSIAGQGTLRTSGLANEGDVHFADGATKVFGPVTNESSCTVIAEGTDATILTFYGPVDNAGEFDILGGMVRFLGGETGVVNSGLLALSGRGQIDPQSAIENNEMFLITGGEAHTVGAISGTGETSVMTGSLTADSIVQDVLTIGAGAKVVIRPLSGGPLASGAGFQSVPEPSSWILLIMAVTAHATFALRKLKFAIIQE